MTDLLKNGLTKKLAVAKLAGFAVSSIIAVVVLVVVPVDRHRIGA